MSFSIRPLAALSAAVLSLVSFAHADEHLWGETRSAETLPQGKFDLYQFVTLRTGKDVGTYRGWDFDTELEYGVTDQLQIGVAAIQHFFHIRNNSELPDMDRYRFGGVEASAKYRILSPFKDPIGLAIRGEFSYLGHDDVAGFEEQETMGGLEVIAQKNFLDDTLILAANAGMQFAWGKKPAEQYDYESAITGALGVSYRFAPGWFIGLEGRVRSEFPESDFHHNEHTVVFAGPALHYGAERWWTTLSWGYQVWGIGVDEPRNQKTFAEEARNEFKFKVGFNF